MLLNNMATFKCRWNTNATSEEYFPPDWLPEYICEAEDEAHALYKYEIWLKGIDKHPSNSEYKIPPIEDYIKRDFASGGWGMYSELID